MESTRDHIECKLHENGSEEFTTKLSALRSQKHPTYRIKLKDSPSTSLLRKMKCHKVMKPPSEPQTKYKFGQLHNVHL